MVLTPRDFYFAGPEVEGPQRYQLGGYHPVHLGDLYSNDRYKVIHKLGFGTYATVWLARDLAAVSETRYVALKFNIAQLTDKSSEVKIFRYLARRSKSHPGFRHVLNLLDHFRIDGVNGTHDVLVFHVVGPRLGDMIDEDPELVQKNARDVVRQVALGTAYLHENDVTHGDLHTGNVAFQIVNLDGMAEQKAIMYLGAPRCIPVIARNHTNQNEALPKYIVIPGSFVDHVIATPGPVKVIIIDLGEAFLASERPQSLNIPIAVRAPELLFNKRSLDFVEKDWDSRTDLWSLGCLIYEIVSTVPLFNPVGDEERLIFDMTAVIGKLPQHWEKYWDWNKKNDPYGQRSLTQSLRGLHEYQKLTRDHILCLTDLLGKLLVLDPKNRMSIVGLLQHTWFDGS